MDVLYRKIAENKAGERKVFWVYRTRSSDLIIKTASDSWDVPHGFGADGFIEGFLGYRVVETITPLDDYWREQEALNKRR